MPEKVTSLNGLKVTSEYCSYKAGSHNKDYVKFNGKIIINQYLKPLSSSNLTVVTLKTMSVPEFVMP